MPPNNSFAKQSREEVSKSQINKSTSKHLWSFSKRKRFQNIKTQCPVAYYQKGVSTITGRKVSFSHSKRKVFTQHSDAPLPGTYEVDGNIKTKGSTLGQGRQKCAFRSYYSKQLAKHPAPNEYVNRQSNKQKGFTFRPRTAHHRNYFIDDLEKKDIPGPFDYHIYIDHEGKTCASKFKTITLGQSLRKTQPRFSHQKVTPGPSLYQPRTVTLRSESTGGAMGSQVRKSFIDKLSFLKENPGPGNYQLPTEFGHYKATNRSHTITRAT